MRVNRSNLRASADGDVIEFRRGGEGGTWQIGAPFGTDFVAVVWAPQPLFDGMGWEVERTEDYLSALNEAFGRLHATPNAVPIVAELVRLSPPPSEIGLRTAASPADTDCDRHLA